MSSDNRCTHFGVTRDTAPLGEFKLLNQAGGANSRSISASAAVNCIRRLCLAPCMCFLKWSSEGAVMSHCSQRRAGRGTRSECESEEPISKEWALLFSSRKRKSGIRLQLGAVVILKSAPAEALSSPSVGGFASPAQAEA